MAVLAGCIIAALFSERDIFYPPTRRTAYVEIMSRIVAEHNRRVTDFASPALAAICTAAALAGRVAYFASPAFARSY